MCGITVYISKDNYSTDKLKNVSYRGPDETTIVTTKFMDYNFYLVFHRLAIIDVAHGHQPFLYQDKSQKVYLLCNGEIYNYQQLIEKYDLETKSDCHVILDLYLKNGIEKTVNELDGEFAFILIDFNSKGMNLYYCRDRFGIRPLFFNEDDKGFYFSSELKGLPSKGLGIQVEPRNIHSINFISKDRTIKKESKLYYEIGKNKFNFINKNIYEQVNFYLKKSVLDRLQSERQIGALLSGGLDSSLVCAIASKYLKLNGKKLKTFSIGIEKDSPDLLYARKVAEFIDSEHHEIIIPIIVWLHYLKEIPKQIETYDITTIRATSAQYLISKWIKENTDVKVLLVGDGSDEMAGGYRYFYNSPNSEEFHLECKRLLSEIHYYDVLRCDRGISAFGLEARVPFLSHQFVDLYLSIDPELRIPIRNKRIEKEILRKSFENDNLLPNEVLYRSKEAFSDGIANERKSLFEYIQENVEKEIDNYDGFPSKEAKYYYNLFKMAYPSFDDLTFKGYWLPKWVGDMKEPSARCLTDV